MSYRSSGAVRRLTTKAPPNYRRMILESRVYDVAEQTPLQVAPVLSHTLQNRVLLKREDMQPVFSFKIRGAYNKMAQLTDAEKAAGCVCCSAGNHAQGVALSARKLGIRAKIVMPLATPDIKVNAVRHHGQDFVEIVLHGKTFDDAAEEARRLVEEEKLTLILPFDDPYIIAGQGTVGLEILQQTSGSEDKVDAIFVPSGGGGMLAGIAAWVKQIRPSVKVVGVEAADAAGMTASLAAGHVVELDHVGLFADGAAVKRVGTETFRVCAQYVDEMVTVSTDEICAAIKAGFKDTRSILEPAGVLSVAGVSQYAKTRGLSGCTFVAVTSGANIDFARLRFVSERADSNERLLAVEIDEIPGAFLRLNRRLDAVGVRITEFSYRYDDAQKARVHLSFHSPTPEHTTAAIQELQRKSSSVGSAPACGGSHQVLDLSDNELAKVHTRYVAGGRARGNLENERLYRFEFPDHPRALATFLEALQSSWNMSLFHYRNHGADVGRVLVGFQVAEQDSNRFQAFLNQLGYVFHEETNNPMYQEFML